MCANIDSDVGQRVRSMLDRAALHAPPQYSLELCQKLEGQLLEVLRAEIYNVISGPVSRKRSVTTARDGTLFSNGAAYQLRMSLSPHDCTHLEIVLERTVPSRSLMVPPTEIYIESGIGRIKKVILYVASIFDRRLYALGDAIKAVIEASYRWLAVYSHGQLLANQKSPSEAYEHIRKVLPEDLCKLIRLNAIVEGRGFYLIDHVVYEGALHSASQSLMNHSRSPIEACADVFTSDVDLELMFSKVVLREDKTNPAANLMRARYASQGVNLSETIVFGTNRITIQPLVKSESFSLVAGYPAHRRNYIEHELHRNRFEFSEIVKRQSSELHQSLTTLHARTSNRPHLSQSIAEFLGAFSAAALQHMSHHPI